MDFRRLELVPHPVLAAAAIALATVALPASGNHYILCDDSGKCESLPPPLPPTQSAVNPLGAPLPPGFVIAGWQDWEDRQGRHLVAGGSNYQASAAGPTQAPSRAMAVVRKLPGGRALDTSFNGTGYVEIPVTGISGEMAYAVAVQPDGKILVGGNTGLPCGEPGYMACDATFVVVMRLLDDGSLDPSFGHNGRTILRVGVGYSSAGVIGLRPAQTGGVTVLGIPDNLDNRPAAIARLDDAGHLETTFTGCELEQPEWRCAAAEFDLDIAIEFYNAQRDHYFVTTQPEELKALDKGLFPGWTRTDRAFAVYPSGSAAPGAMPVCRFYGSPAAGLDTHFYSANASECAGLAARNDGVWTEESADVFRLELPDTSGACAAGRQPVYRLWNGRADVNHRYVTSRSERDAMVRRGFIAEGSGPDRIALCAPMLCAESDAMCRQLQPTQ